MNLFGGLFWLFFWQSAATPTPIPKSLESTSSIFPFGWIIFSALAGFILGVLLTTIIFLLLKRSGGDKEVLIPQTKPEYTNVTPIKQCPKCSSTYTDDSLQYCLRDGLTLKTVGSMPLPHDPDQTWDYSNKKS